MSDKFKRAPFSARNNPQSEIRNFMLNRTRLVLLVAILSAAAGAVVFKTPSVLFLLGTLVAAPLLASAMGKWMSRGLRVSRQMPLVGTVGDELRARVTVRNSGLVPALLVHARGRGWDEKPRRARWLWRARNFERALAPQPKASEFFEVVGEDDLMVPILMPGASFTGEVSWKLRRRGLVDWPGARAGTVDPIGLSDVLAARGAPAQLLILPRPLKLRRLSLGGGSSSAQPLQRVTVAADAAEVHGVRPYQPGEGGRRIHWRATARTGELHVIEWEEETAADLTILLDTGANLVFGAAGDDTLEHGITAAASVAAFLLERGQRARVFWWQDDVAAVAGAPRLMRIDARHQTGLTQILTALAKIVPCQNAGATLAALGERVQRDVGDESALLIGSDQCAWDAALAPWKRGRAGVGGLAFEATSFEESAREGFTLHAGSAVRATLQRAQTSKARPKPVLPAGVRRIKRASSLVDALEKEF